MAKFNHHKITHKFWIDVRGASVNEIVVALYLLTGPQSSRIGIYDLDIGAAAGALGIQKEDFEEALLKVCARFQWTYNESTWVMFVRGYFKYVEIRNPKHLTGILTDLAVITDCDLIKRWAVAAKRHIKEATEKGESYHAIIDAQVTYVLSGLEDTPVAPEPTPAPAQPPTKITTKSKPTTKASRPKEKEVLPEGFQAFWDAYPRKDAKQDAIKAWKSLKPGTELKAKILIDVPKKKKAHDWKSPGAAKWFLLPATYLRGARWEDESGTDIANGKTQEEIDAERERKIKIHNANIAKGFEI